MDLKALLLEAKQKVPPVLQVLHCGDESMLDIGGDTGWETLVQWGRDGNTTEQVHSAPQWPGGLMGAQGLGHRAWPHHHADPPPPPTATPFPQESVAVPSVGAWAIGSPTAPNSRLCRRSRLATSAARTTWPTAPWTSELAVIPLSLQGASVPGAPATSHTPLPRGQEASILGPAGLGWARLDLAACSLCPPELLFLLLFIPAAIKTPAFLVSASVFCLLCPVLPGQASPSDLQSPSQVGPWHLPPLLPYLLVLSCGRSCLPRFPSGGLGYFL